MTVGRFLSNYNIAQLYLRVSRSAKWPHTALGLSFRKRKGEKKNSRVVISLSTFLSTDVNLRVVSSSLRVVIGSKISSGTPVSYLPLRYIYPCYLLLYNRRPRSRPRQLFCFHSEQKHGDKENRGILEAGEVGRK